MKENELKSGEKNNIKNVVAPFCPLWLKPFFGCEF